MEQMTAPRRRRKPWEYAGEVNAGMQVIDRVSPDPLWDEGVDLDRLNVRSCDWCPLAQVFGHWNAGVEEVRAAVPEARRAAFWAEHGFRTEDGRRYGPLTQAWRLAIRRRRAERAALANASYAALRRAAELLDPSVRLYVTDGKEGPAWSSWSSVASTWAQYSEAFPEGAAELSKAMATPRIFRVECVDEVALVLGEASCGG
jgi:hypothetical protein